MFDAKKNLNISLFFDIKQLANVVLIIQDFYLILR